MFLVLSCVFCVFCVVISKRHKHIFSVRAVNAFGRYLREVFLSQWEKRHKSLRGFEVGQCGDVYP